MSEALIKDLEQRLASLKTERLSWWHHWREIADYIIPRRYRWLMTPNELRRGMSLNQRILDSTGTIALRTLSAGMMAGITSPTRPWFKLSIEGFEDDQFSPTVIWLDEVRKRMMRVMSDSNFYDCMAQMYVDLGGFGTGPVLIYEDFKDVIRCYNPCAGEYYLGSDDRNAVDTIYRELPMTLDQMAKKFGKAALRPETRGLLDNPSNLAREHMVGHALEPNKAPYIVPRKFKFRNVYWELGKGGDTILESKGFNEFPLLAPRWDVTGNDPYGRSPAMDALGDIKQLQQETKRKAQAIDKMVNPPMLADFQLKNQPASVLPGGVTFVNNLANNAGMKPVYTVMPPIQEIMLDIKEVQTRIRSIFFNDLFMMFQQLEAEPRSAAAVDARREEKMIQLGPILERLGNEALDPAIDRIFGIMARGGLLPPAPPEAQKKPIKVSYVSMLATAQLAAETAAIERVLATAGNLAGVKPEIMDIIDEQEGLQEYASLLGAPPKMIRSDIAIQAIRADRAKQMEAQQAQQASMAYTGAAKNLSQTDVGGGMNALEAMAGGAPLQ
jgi:hypothetical protein